MDNFCKCGCGKVIEIQKHHSHYGIPNYIRGHNGSFKGKKHSLDAKIKVSIANKGNPGWCKGTKGIMKPNKTSFKKGIRYSQITEIKKGQRLSPSTEFKKGQRPHNYIDGRSRILGPMRYGDDWDKIRLVVYKRDNYICQDCKITMNEYGKPLDIHHLIPYLFSGDNSIENLTTLCRSCHMKEEHKLRKEVQIHCHQ